MRHECPRCGVLWGCTADPCYAPFKIECPACYLARRAPDGRGCFIGILDAILAVVATAFFLLFESILPPNDE